MKKILVISDTHKNLSKLENIAGYLKEQKIDFFFHCGDHEENTDKISEILGINGMFVDGNCDKGNLKKIEFIKIYGKKFLITHGDLYGVNFDLNRLYYLAKENNCDAVAFGHTHIPIAEDVDGMIMLNPGSLSKPRDGKNGSIGYFIIDEDEVLRANIVYYETIIKNLEKNKSAKEGNIKNILNYSDRF